jgi:hypothetical protein
MNLKICLVSLILLLFNSCESLQSNPVQNKPEEKQQNSQLCIWHETSKIDDCDIVYWFKYWSDIDEISWPERQKLITDLTDQDEDILKKILLSQGKNTPYQNRLRAQTWAVSLFPKLSESMRKFIQVAIYQPSQELLEMESVLVTLGKINTQQSSDIEQKILMLNKQQDQLEQLLNIEKSIMESGEKEKQ